MNFRTVINIKKSFKQIDYNSKIMMVGSCFAQNMGEIFSNLGFDVLINPFGTQYNPLSILQTLRRLLKGDEIKKEELFFYNESFHHFSFHGEFSKPNIQESLDIMNGSLRKGQKALKEIDFLFVTFGTSYIYRLAKDTSVSNYLNINDWNKDIVSNCHKLPASEFNRYKASLPIMISEWESFISGYSKLNPQVKIILTVSPIRHLSDGLEENQVSKAQLIILAHALQEKYNNVNYFPAYEIMMDDLRDYRFYKGDMIHPSEQAIEYIKEKFINSHVSDDCLRMIKKIDKLQLALAHKPFNAEGREYRKFVEKHIEILDALLNEYPNLQLSKLKNAFLEKIK